MPADALDAPRARLTYGQALAREMAKRGTTRRILANNCRVSEAVVQQWERDELVPTGRQHKLVVSTLNSMRFYPPPPSAPTLVQSVDTHGTEPPEPVIVPPALPSGAKPTAQLPFGEALRRERTLEGTTARDVAYVLECAPSAISNWENGLGMHEDWYRKVCALFPRLKEAKPPVLSTGGMRGRTPKRRTLNAADVPPAEQSRRAQQQTAEVKRTPTLTTTLGDLIGVPLVATTDHLKLPARGALAAVQPVPATAEQRVDQRAATMDAELQHTPQAVNQRAIDAGLNRHDRRALGLVQTVQKAEKLVDKIDRLDAEVKETTTKAREAHEHADYLEQVSDAFDAAIDMVGGTYSPDEMEPERRRLRALKDATLKRLDEQHHAPPPPPADDKGAEALTEQVLAMATAMYPGDAPLCLIEAKGSHYVVTVVELFEATAPTVRDALRTIRQQLSDSIDKQAAQLRAEAEATAQRLRDQAMALERLKRGT